MNSQAGRRAVQTQDLVVSGQQGARTQLQGQIEKHLVIRVAALQAWARRDERLHHPCPTVPPIHRPSALRREPSKLRPRQHGFKLVSHGLRCVPAQRVTRQRQPEPVAAGVGKDEQIQNDIGVEYDGSCETRRFARVQSTLTGEKYLLHNLRLR